MRCRAPRRSRRRRSSRRRPRPRRRAGTGSRSRSFVDAGDGAADLGVHPGGDGEVRAAAAAGAHERPGVIGGVGAHDEGSGGAGRPGRGDRLGHQARRAAGGGGVAAAQPRGRDHRGRQRGGHGRGQRVEPAHGRDEAAAASWTLIRAQPSDAPITARKEESGVHRRTQDRRITRTCSTARLRQAGDAQPDRPSAAVRLLRGSRWPCDAEDDRALRETCGRRSGDGDHGELRHQ